ncbi:hypothetical protein ACWGB8_20110 [Kitasatospora sp. NPDC054939]
MKKRSILAVASLAVGVVASLTAPSAHAGALGGQEDLTGPLNRTDLLVGTPDAVEGQVSGATTHMTGTAEGLLG